ncbi:hypothetical protein QK911_10355 [Lactococcus lactis]
MEEAANNQLGTNNSQDSGFYGPNNSVIFYDSKEKTLCHQRAQMQI